MKETLLNENRKTPHFYGCDRFPECEFVSWDKPIERKCPKCENMLVEKKLKKGVQVQCVNCDYKEEQQNSGEQPCSPAFYVIKQTLRNRRVVQ